MKHTEVKSLFKYTQINKNQLSALAQKKIWYSKPLQFNDPFDTRFYPVGDLKQKVLCMDQQKINKIFGESMEGAIVMENRSIQPELDDFKRDLEEQGILSLCTGKNNLLMWAHYGDEHKGMCLEFDRIHKLADDKLTKAINYTDNHPTLSTKSLTDNTQKKDSMRRILFTKSKHWAYEQEWRHIVEQGGALHNWPAPLKAVYFGCKTPIEDIQLVRSVLTSSLIKFYQFELNKTTFGVKQRAI